MHEDLKIYIEEIEIILKEIDRYKSFKKQFLFDLKALNTKYEKGHLSYEEYTKLKEKLFSGKTKEDNIEYFNSYILSLVRKLEYLNTQIFSLIYSDESYNTLKSKEHVLIRKAPKTLQKPQERPSGRILKEPWKEKPAAIEESAGSRPAITRGDIKKVPPGRTVEVYEEATPVETVKGKKEKAGIESQSDVKTLGTEDEDAQILALKAEKKQEKSIFGTNALDAEETIEMARPEEAAAQYGVPHPKKRVQHDVPHPKKEKASSLLKRMFTGEKSSIFKSDDKVGFKSILNFGFLKDFIRRVSEKEEVISKDTKREHSLLDFHEVGPINFEEEAKTNPNLLVKQATQLKELLKKRKIKIYSPNAIGTLANVSVRRLSVFIIDSFPEFFKRFYITLRYANIKVLSNTYVNIMVFLSLIASFIFGAVAAVFAVAEANPMFLVISKTGLMATLGAALVTGFMIYYPNMKIKQRVRSINTNLPFAIDHMSSLVASGVSPATMFRLLTESKEYGEVSLEIEKVSNFIDVFGYDLITAVKSVSATTPSPQFKEFLDGLVSTIESGGSLKNYLSQRSKESMLSYRLERQKYLENIGTYSDIYTGVLIAAPLFFVSALSLVSMLGGKIGGFDVEDVIAFGTYIVIPALNVMFIIFLEFNQPEV